MARTRALYYLAVVLGLGLFARTGCSDESINPAPILGTGTPAEGGGGAGGEGVPPGCGDGACVPGETCSNCEGDCGNCDCGDGTCGENELCGTCPGDCGACTGAPIAVVRGPYLQRGSSSGVVVRWRTAEPSESVVAYGPSAIALSSVAATPGPTTEHVVEISGLEPDTKYSYAFGTPESELVGGDDDHYMRTPPATGSSRPTRIWIIGDAGTANADQQAVRDSYYTYNGAPTADLFIMLGDNAYDDGTDSEFQGAVYDMYPDVLKHSVLYPTLGNHDGHTSDSDTQSGPYYDMFTLPTQAEAGGVASGTEAYYSFDFGHIHFVCLDSYESDRSPRGAMLTWLTNDLEATTQPWLIAFWHHPPYSKGSHDSDDEDELIEMRENALPILEAHGVDLVLSGHSHAYERSVFLNGHYDTSDTLTPAMVIDGGDGQTEGDGAYAREAGSTAGAVYVVAGSSGKTSGGDLDHPAMYISLDQLGSMVLDSDGARLDVGFLDDMGTLRDHFTLSKE
jgi:acid phosphatase type 7